MPRSRRFSHLSARLAPLLQSFAPSPSVAKKSKRPSFSPSHALSVAVDDLDVVSHLRFRRVLNRAKPYYCELVDQRGPGKFWRQKERGAAQLLQFASFVSSSGQSGALELCRRVNFFKSCFAPACMYCRDAATKRARLLGEGLHWMRLQNSPAFRTVIFRLPPTEGLPSYAFRVTGCGPDVVRGGPMARSVKARSVRTPARVHSRGV